MRRRFFVDEFANGTARLSGEAAHHWGRVLRAEPGQLYELSDGHTVHLGGGAFLRTGPASALQNMTQ
jgi:16S rRNA U1498 N3-methylase RsmE